MYNNVREQFNCHRHAQLDVFIPPENLPRYIIDYTYLKWREIFA